MNIRKTIFAFAAIITSPAISQADNAPAVNAFNHIVVIVQENHSFDNLYGLWGKVNGMACPTLICHIQSKFKRTVRPFTHASCRTMLTSHRFRHCQRPARTVPMARTS